MNPPLAVLRYLAELDSALAARNAPDRDQIVTQIGEHITQALGDLPDPTDADIAAVLAELGDPLRIADEAAEPALGAATSPARQPCRQSSVDPAARIPLLQRPWIPMLAAGLSFVGVLWPLLAPWRQVSGGDTMREAVLVFVRDIPLIASIVLVLCSPLYRPTGRVLWTVLSPVFLTATLMLTRVSLFYGSVPWLFTTACAIAAIAGLLAVVVITRAARRRTAAGPSRPGARGLGDLSTSRAVT